MSEDNIEETIETTEETTSVEETSNEENSKINPQGSSLEEKNKQLYARAKAAEEEAKRLKEELKKREGAKQDNQTNQEPINSNIDPFETIDLINTLKDFNQDELDFVKTIAKGKNISLKEAALSEDVKLYIEAKREKIKKDNLTPSPSNKIVNPSLTAEEALSKGIFKTLPIEEQEKLIKDADKRFR